MKKVLLFTALAAALTAGFAQANEKLVVAATPIPHAEILERRFEQRRVLLQRLGRLGQHRDLGTRERVDPGLEAGQRLLQAQAVGHEPNARPVRGRMLTACDPLFTPNCA